MEDVEFDKGSWKNKKNFKRFISYDFQCLFNLSMDGPVPIGQAPTLQPTHPPFAIDNT